MATDPASPVAARCRGVHVAFGERRALRGVDVDAHAGRVLAIAGANGAGKSTLLEVLAGTRAPTAGDRWASGSIAFVPQRAAVADTLPITVRDVAAVGVWGRSGPWRRLSGALRADVEGALRRMGVHGLAARRWSELSGGQRQRALLAQGLAGRADLLLLDEPTTGLDADSGEAVRAALRAEATRGAAVVCVSHDPAVLAEADTVLTLTDGVVARC